MKALLTPYLIRKRTEITVKYVYGDVLDIGCGTAYILSFLDKHTYYVGIDLDEKMGSIIKEKAKKYQIDASFYQCDIENDPLPDLNYKFDSITMIALVEHLKEPRTLIVQLSKYLKNNGRLIVTTPHPVSESIHKYGSKLGLFSQEAVEDHEQLYDHDSIVEFLNICGFSVEEYHRFELGLNQLIYAKME